MPLFCGGYKIDYDALKKAVDYEKRSASGTNGIQSNNSYQIRVYLHIFTNNDGTNAAATPAQVEGEFAQLVADYAPGGICFINAGANYLASTALNVNFNADNDAASLFDPYRVPNCLNLFYMRAIGGTNKACSSNCGYGGITLGIPNTFCLIATSNLGYRHTTSHETGHCLGLLHTFDFSNGYEDIDGSNSSSTGDLITDTHADPFGYNANSCYSQTACAYTGSCTDPKGQNNFSPPYTNTMGYWGNNTCYSTPFALTNGQFVRAISFLNTYGDLENCQSSTSAVTVGPINIAGQYYFNSSVGTVSTSGAVNISENSVVMLAGKLVELQPGFHAYPATNGIVIIQTALCGGSSPAAIAQAPTDAKAVIATTGNAMVAYPNPASTAINLAITLANDQKNSVLQLYDLNGRKLKEINLRDLYTGQQNVALVVNDIPSGIYYVMLRLKEAILTTKIVVAR